MTTHSLAVLGLPRAGKSVFLGRLWHAVQHDHRRLQKRGQPADLQPLRVLGAPLEDGMFPDRTSRDAPPSFVAPLRWSGAIVRDIDLHATDYNGERLRGIWRRDADAWSEDWEARAHAEGIAVVVRADLVRRALGSRPLIPSAQGDDRPRRLFPDTQPDFHARPDDAVAAPTAVELVELLQVLRHVRGLAAGQVEPGFRIAVLLTAWDAIDAALQETGPRRFLEEELGLLDDLLATNFNPGDIRAFGLSAVGGDLTNTDYRNKFLQGEVDEHGWVTWDANGVRMSGDVTLPIGWLLLGDDALLEDEGEAWKR